MANIDQRIHVFIQPTFKKKLCIYQRFDKYYIHTKTLLKVAMDTVIRLHYARVGVCTWKTS
jgi:hypothetical protein